MIFLIKVENGKIAEWSAPIASHIRNSKDWFYSVEIKLWSKRSIVQNAFYRAIMWIVGDDLGYTKQEMANIFKSMFLRKEWKDWRLWKIEIVESTTNLTVKEFNEYLDNICNRCKDNWIIIPIDPNI